MALLLLCCIDIYSLAGYAGSCLEELVSPLQSSLKVFNSVDKKQTLKCSCLSLLDKETEVQNRMITCSCPAHRLSPYAIHLSLPNSFYFTFFQITVGLWTAKVFHLISSYMPYFELKVSPLKNSATFQVGLYPQEFVGILMGELTYFKASLSAQHHISVPRLF